MLLNQKVRIPDGLIIAAPGCRPGMEKHNVSPDEVLIVREEPYRKVPAGHDPGESKVRVVAEDRTRGFAGNGGWWVEVGRVEELRE